MPERKNKFSFPVRQTEFSGIEQRTFAKYMCVLFYFIFLKLKPFRILGIVTQYFKRLLLGMKSFPYIPIRR